MVGCYNGDPEVKDGDRHGVDFTLRGPAFVIGEVGYRRNYGPDASGLPGNLKLGVYFNGGDAEVFGSGVTGQSNESVRARYGVYVLGDQALVRWGDPAEKRHLGVFGAFACAPDQRVNPVPYFFDAGLVAYGFLPSRPRDFAAFGVAYGSYSDDLRRAAELPALTTPAVGVQSYEMTLEWNYGCIVRARPKPFLHDRLCWCFSPFRRAPAWRESSDRRRTVVSSSGESTFGGSKPAAKAYGSSVRTRA